MSPIRSSMSSSGPIPVLLMVREVGIGGCETDLTKLATGLDPRRFEPHVGCFLPTGLRVPQLQAAGIPIVHFPVTSMLSSSWLSGARVLSGYIRRHKIQVVHAFDAPMDVFGVP